MSEPIFNWPTSAELFSLSLAVSAGGASLLGFVLAANTFLISHTQNRRLAMLRKSDGFDQLLEIMRSSLWRLFALSLYAGVGSLVAEQHTVAMLVGLTFLIVLSALVLATLIWSTMAVLSIPLD